MQSDDVATTECFPQDASDSTFEVWRPIRCGSYEVSNLGRVRNAKTGRIKVQYRIGAGYRGVGLFRKEQASVHRLVAEAFLGLEPGLEVNHIDGDKANNRVTNLEWVTHSTNQRHAYRVLGTLKLNLPWSRGEANCAAKLTDQDIVEIRDLRDSGLLQREIAARFGVTQSAVSNILAKRTWKHVA
jgi:HNH endonuclease/NUMOD4 motif-containing protein